jgi:hypothetical protein
MTNFSLRCDYKPHQHGDYAPPKRGHAVVDDGDGHGYRYRVRRGELRSFRRWLITTFARDGWRIGGRYPWYHVEREKR